MATKGMIYAWDNGVVYHGWFAKYKVQYLEDGHDVPSDSWQYVDAGKVFEGNCDALREVIRLFEQPVLCRSIRIEIVDWAHLVVQRSKPISFAIK